MVLMMMTKMVIKIPNKDNKGDDDDDKDNKGDDDDDRSEMTLKTAVGTPMLNQSRETKIG